jgi:menaquinone-dependent protoporphyrinogen IX oxidase
MAKVLLLYSTTDGHTVEICKRLASVIENAGDTVEIENLTGMASINRWSMSS